MEEKKIHEFLRRSEIEKIHEASIEVLAEVGVKISHPEIRLLLLEAGAKEGKESILFFPSTLIEECLKKAPGSKFHLTSPGHSIPTRTPFSAER